MIQITSFAEANQYLARFYDNSRTEYTLDNMRQLMADLDNPQEKFKAVHVAGTSGKTSTAYYASAMLTAAGHKTGLTVSPHVDEINERIQINGQPLSEAEFCQALSEFLQLLATAKLQPSWFEVMVAFAYWYFAGEGVEYAVVEVGLGGLKDGTNVISRPDKVCIITDIGLDHTHVLGNSLAEIAAQKAGIIQPGNTTFMYRQDDSVMQVVVAAAKKQAADLKVIEPDQIPTSNLPIFQRRNSYLAQQAIDFTLQRDTGQGLSPIALASAMKIYVPGRMEIINYRGKTVVLDGAHNAQKLGTLFDSLHAKYPHKQIAALVAFASGDEQRLGGALEVLLNNCNQLIVTSFSAAQDYLKQSVEPPKVVNMAQSMGFAVSGEADTAVAFQKLMDLPEDVLLISGSFYLLNHIRPLMLKA